MSRIELSVKAVARLAGRVPLVRLSSESHWQFPSGPHTYGHQLLDRASDIAETLLRADFEALEVLSQYERLETGRHEYFLCVRGILRGIPRPAPGYELLLVSQDNLYLHVAEVDPYDLILLERVLFTPDF